jgi:hypothetical protein
MLFHTKHIVKPKNISVSCAFNFKAEPKTKNTNKPDPSAIKSVKKDTLSASTTSTMDLAWIFQNFVSFLQKTEKRCLHNPINVEKLTHAPILARVRTEPLGRVFKNWVASNRMMARVKIRSRARNQELREGSLMFMSYWCWFLRLTSKCLQLCQTFGKLPLAFFSAASVGWGTATTQA